VVFFPSLIQFFRRIRMSKKLGPLMIGLVAVALVAGCNRSESPRTQSQNDSAVVAGKNTPPPATPSPNSAANPANPAGPTSEPGATAGTTNPGATPGKDQYSADLRKCDAMPEGDRARCVEQAKKQHGQM
jgi:cell wall-associated NlpC family hydrolase